MCSSRSRREERERRWRSSFQRTSWRVASTRTCFTIRWWARACHLRHIIEDDFLTKLVTLPELWSQPSFPEFVDWLIRFRNIILVFPLWLFPNKSLYRDRAGKSPTPASWSDENAWLPFYTGLTFRLVPLFCHNNSILSLALSSTIWHIIGIFQCALYVIFPTLC